MKNSAKYVIEICVGYIPQPSVFSRLGKYAIFLSYAYFGMHLVEENDLVGKWMIENGHLRWFEESEFWLKLNWIGWLNQ